MFGIVLVYVATSATQKLHNILTQNLHLPWVLYPSCRPRSPLSFHKAGMRWQSHSTFCL